MKARFIEEVVLKKVCEGGGGGLKMCKVNRIFKIVGVCYSEKLPEH